MVRYNKILAIATVLIFFSGLDLYLLLGGFSTIVPKLWVGGFAALVAPLAIARLARRQLLPPQLGPIVMWCVAYVALSAIWYAFWPSDVAAQELADRVLSVVFLGLAAFVFGDAESRRLAGMTTVAVVLLMVAINGLQTVNADWFAMDVPTRSSGLYVNANQCASALVIGMVVAWPFVRGPLRPLFVLVVGAGVFVTFSRSGMTGWFLAGVVLLAFEARSLKRLVLAGAGVAILAVIVIQAGTAAGITDAMNLDDDQLDRVSFFQTLTASDESTQVRREIVSKAWPMVAESPLVGNGLASTLQSGELQSTHNMFLSHMADHGLLGALILPALVLCVCAARQKAAAGPHWAFCAFTLWYAFFSHNILTERYHLIGFALFGMGGVAYATDSLGARIRRVIPNRSTPITLAAPGSAIGSIR